MRRTIPILTLLTLLMVPMAYGVTIDGPLNFVHTHGGNVTFQLQATSNQIYTEGNTTRFQRFTHGGSSYGRIGFDADTGVTMTVLDVQDEQVTYNVTAAGDTYIHYDEKGPPSSVTGGTHTYDPNLQTTTVTTTGAGEVTVEWQPERTSLYNNLLNYLVIGGLIPLVAAAVYLVQVLQGGELSHEVVILIAGIVIAFVVIASILAGYV